MHDSLCHSAGDKYYPNTVKVTRALLVINCMNIIVGQGPTVVAVGADEVVWIFCLKSFRFLFRPSRRRPDID